MRRRIGVGVSAIVFAFGLSLERARADIQVAVTVDDLPAHGPLPEGVTRTDLARKMLAAFEKFRVPEVYGFINADRLDGAQPRSPLTMWRDAGFPLGNHTFNHPDLNKVSIDEFKREIDLNEPVLRSLSGEKGWRYFRYPFLREGETLEKRNAIRQYLAEKGYTIAQVTIDFEDWSWNAPYSRCVAAKDHEKLQWLEDTYLKNASDMLNRATQAAKALFGRDISHVLLLHIGAFDAEMLEKLLKRFQDGGSTFISLPEALRDPVYRTDPGVAARYGSEFQYQVMKARGLKASDLGLQPYKGYPEKELDQVCRERK